MLPTSLDLPSLAANSLLPKIPDTNTVWGRRACIIEFVVPLRIFLSFAVQPF